MIPDRKPLQSFYRTSKQYGERLKGSEQHAPEYADYLRLVQQWAPAGARLLDLGCGTGYTSAQLARAGYEVVGVDLSPLFLRPREECSSGLALLAADAFQLPFREGCFEVVTSFQFIERYRVAKISHGSAGMGLTMRPSGSNHP